MSNPVEQPNIKGKKRRIVDTTGGDAYLVDSAGTASVCREQLAFDPTPTISAEFALDQRLVILQANAKEACKQLPRGLFSLIITSPPYNIGKSYERQVNLSQYLAWQTTIIEQLMSLLKRQEVSVCEA